MAKTGLALAWVAGQAALVLTAGQRSEGAFGFRMFAESSTISVRLFRAVDAPSGHGAVAVEVPGGDWTARDPSGNPHRFSWRARVRERELSTFEQTMAAGYGAAAQLERWNAALHDVAQHVTEDAETRALELEITVRRNGRPPTVTHLRAER